MKLKLNLSALALLCGALTAAPVVDDFTSGLENWTATVILDNGGAASNTFAFQVNDSDQLELETTVYDNIEQYAFILNDAALEIGEEAQIDMTIPITGNRNLGLYVGGTAPKVGVVDIPTREDFITMYAESDTNRVSSRGFDGTTEYNNPNALSTDALTLFIARTDTNIFEAGYYTASERIIVTTREPITPNTADFVGIYADSRAEGIVGAIDAFRIIDLDAPPVETEILITAIEQSRDGQYVLNFTGPGNQTFTVKKSSNLADGFATLAATDAPVTTDAEGNGQAILTVPVDALSTEFYRVEINP